MTTNYTFHTDMPKKRYTLTYVTKYGVHQEEYLDNGEYALAYAKWLYTSRSAWCVALHDAHAHGRCVYHRADSVYHV